MVPAARDNTPNTAKRSTTIAGPSFLRYGLPTRTSISHEGELDPRLRFNDNGSLEIGLGNWNLPSGYIVGMSVAVIVAHENLAERISSEVCLSLYGRQFRVNDLWGKREVIKNVIRERFNNLKHFERI